MNIVRLEKSAKYDDPVVMPMGKRTTEEKEGRSPTGPSKKKGKSHEDEDVKAKRKRRASRKFHVIDSPLGEGQESYSLTEDITKRKAYVKFGYLIQVVPKLECQWKKSVNPMERKLKKGSIKVLVAVDKLPSIYAP